MISSLTEMLELLKVGHMTTFTLQFESHDKNFFSDVTDKSYGVITSKVFILRRPGIAILLTSSKLRPRLLKESLKTQEKLEELEIMYLNGIYICISWYSKIC